MIQPNRAKTLDRALLEAGNPQLGIHYVESGDSEKFISYAQQLQRSLGILHHFQSKGVKPGDELVLLTGENTIFIDAFWAGILGGIVPVPVAPGISEEHSHKLFGIFSELRNPWLYTGKKNLERLESFARKRNLESAFHQLNNRVMFSDDIRDISQPGQLHATRPEDVAFIQFSSGSTSFPKGVVVTHESVMSNTRAIAGSMQLHSGDSYLSWMPLAHDMGLVGFHLTPLVCGISQYILPTELFIRRPLLWMQLVWERKVTTTCSPNFGYSHFLNAYTVEKAQGWDLSSLRVIFNGAEPISVRLCLDFLETMSKHGLDQRAMMPAYGLAEATLAVTVHPQNSDLHVYHIERRQLAEGGSVDLKLVPGEHTVAFAGEGSPVEGCQVMIADKSRNELPSGTIGHILIRGINVTKGYYGNPEGINERVIVAGWLDTGDLGLMHHGELIVTGRSKDIIFLNGQNFYPSDLERILEQLDEIDLGKVAVCGVNQNQDASDKVLVFVLFKGNPGRFIPLVKKIKQLIVENTGLDVHQVIPIKKMPKTTSGKIKRFLLANQFLEGNFNEEIAGLEVLHQAVTDPEESDHSPTQIKIKEICNRFIAGHNVGVHDNLFELGTSSLMLTQIHEQIEEIWPGTIELTDYFDYPTVAALASYLDKVSPRSQDIQQ